MVKLLFTYMLCAASLLQAQEEYYGLEDWEPQRLWSLELAMGYASAVENSAQALLARDFLFASAWVDAAVIPRLAWESDGSMDSAAHSVVPSLELRLSRAHGVLALTAWMLYAPVMDSTDWGASFSWLAMGNPWRGGEWEVGPELNYQAAIGWTPAWTGFVGHAWNMGAAWEHGPGLNGWLEWESGLAGKRSGRYTMSHALVEPVYRMGWTAATGAWGLMALAGYGWDLSSSKEQSRDGDLGGLRLRLSAGYSW